MFLKQSTAVVIPFGPFVSQSDGVTLVTTLVSAIDHASTGIKLSKNGGALTIRHATVTASTYDAYGNYLVTLDTTDTNTLGTLRVQFADATTNLPVWQDFHVVTATVYNSLIATGDLATGAAASVTAAVALTSAYDAAKTAAQAGNQMDLVNAPNATAITAIQSGLATGASQTTINNNVLAVPGAVTSDHGAGSYARNTEPDNSGITAIKAKTDSLTFTQAGVLDSNVLYVHNVQIKGTGVAGDTWGPV